MLKDGFKTDYKKLPIVAWFNDDVEIYPDLHNHEEFEMTVVTEGSYEVLRSDVAHTVKKGDIIFVNPFEVHAAKSYGKTASEECFCFDCELIADKAVAQSIRSGDVRIVSFVDGDSPDAGQIRSMFKDIVKCYKKEGECMELKIRAYISLLFAFLIENGYTEEVSKETKTWVFGKNVLNYISENYNKNITSKDVAEALSYNHSYFCRRFKDNFDRKFCDYLNMYRIVEAKKLLCNTNKSVADIAASCGFKSQTYFSNCFRKYVGMSTTEYKQKTKNTIGE